MLVTNSLSTDVTQCASTRPTPCNTRNPIAWPLHPTITASLAPTEWRRDGVDGGGRLGRCVTWATLATPRRLPARVSHWPGPFHERGCRGAVRMLASCNGCDAPRCGRVRGALFVLVTHNQTGAWHCRIGSAAANETVPAVTWHQRPTAPQQFIAMADCLVDANAPSTCLAKQVATLSARFVTHTSMGLRGRPGKVDKRNENEAGERKRARARPTCEN